MTTFAHRGCFRNPTHRSLLALCVPRAAAAAAAAAAASAAVLGSAQFYLYYLIKD